MQILITRYHTPSLFDVIPGLETFELKTHRNSAESRGFAYAQYRTLELACYAKRLVFGTASTSFLQQADLSKLF